MPIAPLVWPRIKAHAALAAPYRALFLAIALAGCGGGGDPAKELDTASSWTATARLTLAERRSGAITRTYATQIDDQARQALLQLRQAPASAGHDTSSARRAASLDSLDRAIHALDAELRR